VIDASYLLFLSIASKRSLEDAGEGPSSKRHRSEPLEDAITSAGLAHKAIKDDTTYLSKLDSKERVLLLKHLGQSLSGDSMYFSLPKAACALQQVHANLQENDTDLSKIGNYIQSLELLSAPPNTSFPIVDASDLYIRKEYKELYKEITASFTDDPLSSLENRIVVTGTPGIGKSAFLVYFVVRLLAESDDGEPPIIIFQLKESTRCVVYGGTSVVREGDITVFEDLLDLPETWHLSDSSETPKLQCSKTIISASPKTLMDTYHEAIKEAPDYYYMSPWGLDELEKCRSNVTNFKVVEPKFLERLYAKIGGIPRYVLESPSVELGRIRKATGRYKRANVEKEADVEDMKESDVEDMESDVEDMESDVEDMESDVEDMKESDVEDMKESDVEDMKESDVEDMKESDVEDKAEMRAYLRIKEAVDFVQEPHKLLECFANALQFSGRILHRWPNTAHDDYCLKWGSEHIKDEIVKCLKSRSWAVLLQSLVHGGQEISKGLLFELYIHHIFRKGGFSFEIKALEDEEVCGPLDIPANSPVKNIRTVADLSTLSAEWSEMPLFILTFSNFPCIDLALAPDKLFQVTVSLNHPIKQAPLKEIVEAILGEVPETNTYVGLYFVVPNSIYEFKVQSYSTAAGTTSEKVPGIITRHVRQYAFKVNLDSALATVSPGMDTSQ